MSALTATIPAPVETGLNRTLAALIGAMVAFGGNLHLDLLAVALLAALVITHRVKRIPDPATAFLASLALAFIPAWMVTPGSSHEVWSGAAALLAAFGLYAAGLTLGAWPGLLRFLVLGLYGGIWIRIAAGGALESSLGAAALILVLGASMEPGRVRRWVLGTGCAAAALACWSGGPVIRAAVVTGAALFGLLTWRDLHPRSFRGWAIGAVAALALVAAGWTRIGATPIESLVARDGIVRGFAQDAWTAASATFPYGAGVGRAEGLAPELGMLGLAGFAAMIALPLWRGRRIQPGLARRMLASVLPASLILLVAAPLHADRAFLLLLGTSTALAKVAGPRFASRAEPVRRSNRSPEAIPCGA